VGRVAPARVQDDPHHRAEEVGEVDGVDQQPAGVGAQGQGLPALLLLALGVEFGRQASELRVGGRGQGQVGQAALDEEVDDLEQQPEAALEGAAGLVARQEVVVQDQAQDVVEPIAVEEPLAPLVLLLQLRLLTYIIIIFNIILVLPIIIIIIIIIIKQNYVRCPFRRRP
jgi:hypothetical protein